MSDVEIKGYVTVIDDEELVGRALADVLSDEGFQVATFRSFAEAEPRLAQDPVDVVLLDIWLKGEDGVELVPRVLASPSRPAVIMISGHANVEQAVKCTKKGAYDFIEKPLSTERVLLTIHHAMDSRRLSAENLRLVDARLREELSGRSALIQQLRQTVLAVARSHSSALIVGENGTGKEIVARMIHAHSPRARNPFVPVNCAAIPDTLIESEFFGYERGAFTGAHHARVGKIETANEGTLFLDEVGDLSLAAQAKLLRVIQERQVCRLSSHKEIPVNVRWIAATNKDLEALCRKGLFREDLFYRLNVIRVEVPPLRMRKEDIELLAMGFLNEFCVSGGYPSKTLTSDALDRLKNYSWPGNVRELRNTIERAVVLNDTNELDSSTLHFPEGTEVLSPDTISKVNPEKLLDMPRFKEAREAFEKLFLLSQLKRSGTNISKMAQAIGLDRTYLHRKLKHYGLDQSQASENS